MWALGVVNSKKLSSPELFSKDFVPKVTEQDEDFSGGLRLELHSGLKPQICIQSVLLQI